MRKMKENVKVCKKVVIAKQQQLDELIKQQEQYKIEYENLEMKKNGKSRRTGGADFGTC